MILRDKYGRFIEDDMPIDIELELWQSGLINYGYYDPFRTDQDSGEKNNFSKPIDRQNDKW